jgi:SAM-dependent methyltransferase
MAARDATDRPTLGAPGDAWTSDALTRGWHEGAVARDQALGPLTELMLDLAGVTVDSWVLDVGAGTGDQTTVAARRVGPGGAVLATDISAAILARASEATRVARLSAVQAVVMDAQRLALASGSVDAAIARFSLQFVPDVQRALAEVRRVLRPGGRFAAVVFSAVERNPFRAAPQAIASRLAGQPFPPFGPGQWALNDPATLADAFRRAGFKAVEVRPVPFVYRFASLADALENQAVAQPLFTQLLESLSEADRAAAWVEITRTFQPFVAPDGFSAPNEALLAAGAT